jgi:hypothetical protein
MITIFQILLCVFVMAACVHAIIGENKRGRQMDEIFKTLRKRCEENKNES